MDRMTLLLNFFPGKKITPYLKKFFLFFFLPRISASDSHYCQLHALIMHYSHQAAVQENTSLKMLLFSENSTHGCSSWGHVQQAGSLHVRAKERQEALPTLSGLNSHSDILRS